MQIQYLEIITPQVESVCAQYATTHGLTFGKPNASLGNARTADLSTGGVIGVREPMHETEAPVVRPYYLTADIEQTISALQQMGAEITHAPLELPGHGTFAIYKLGGIDQGLWQL